MSDQTINNEIDRLVSERVATLSISGLARVTAVDLIKSITSLPLLLGILVIVERMLINASENDNWMQLHENL